MRLFFTRWRVRGVVASLPYHHDANGAAPFVEHIHDVGFAELHANGTPPRPLGVIPVEITIDSATGYLERHTSRLPGRHEVERRPGDPNQVTVILLAEVILYLAAVVY